jgi:hypothetical protein
MTGTQSEDHAHRRVAGVEERRDDLEPLEGAGLLLALAGADDLAQRLGLGLEVEGLEALLQRRGAHAALEVHAEAVAHLAVEDLVALEVLDLEVAEPVPDLVRRSISASARLRIWFISRSADSRTLRLTSDLAPSASSAEVGLEDLLAGLDVGVPAGLDLLALDTDLRLERREVAVTLLLVDRRDHVGREVDDLLEVLRGQVEQVAEPRGHALEVPDVGDGRGQLDVAHPLTTHLGASDLDAAALADDALEPDPLVLPAVALPVRVGPKIFSQKSPSFSGFRCGS